MSQIVVPKELVLLREAWKIYAASSWRDDNFEKAMRQVTILIRDNLGMNKKEPREY